MAAEQSMMQKIKESVIKTIKAVLMTVRDAENPVNNARPVHTAPRSGEPALK